MAGVTGLEPAASCVTGKRSNQLSYTPKKNGTYLMDIFDIKIEIFKEIKINL